MKSTLLSRALLF
jgi:hypothetical protein